MQFSLLNVLKNALRNFSNIDLDNRKKDRWALFKINLWGSGHFYNNMKEIKN